MMLKPLCLILALAVTGCSPDPTGTSETSKTPEGSGNAASAVWPRFLGPNGNNVSDAKGLPLTWEDKKGKNIRWKVALPGEGWSTPVLAEGRAYCTTALDGGKSLHALCISLADGKLLWDVEVFRNAEVPAKHNRNSYASPTPLLEGDRLYVTFGTMGTACLSTTDGAKVWENRELKWDQQNGPGGSMAGHGDLLLIPCDGADVQFEAALSKKDGKIVWKSERSAKEVLAQRPKDMHKAYGTPVIFNVDGKAVSFTTAAQRLYALDPATGKELWYINYAPNFSNVPVPVSDGKNIYISTGFQKPETWAVKLASGRGDVTETHVVWKQKKGAPYESTPVVFGDRLYMVNSGGIASCLNTADGSIVWQERIGPDFAATPLVADGRIYFFDTWNKAYVIEPGDTFKLLATNRLESGCMASPVPIPNGLIVRTKTHLYRIEEKK